MAHRIEIELTSQSGPTSWTWRASGAKKPRGSVDAGLVPEGSVVGTVLRAEVETTLDGTTVTSLLPVKAKGDLRDIARIEVIGTPQKGPDVNVVLASKSKRGREGRTDGPRDPARRPSDRRPRADGDNASHRGGAAGQRGQSDRGGSKEPGASGARRPGSPRSGARESTGRDGARRPAASTVYRNAALATLKPEQIPVAEQLLKGGLPAVRQALEEQNARARGEGRPEVTPGPLLALAEQLRPIVNLASWKDRASVARSAGKDTPLRELRSIVAAASTVTLDDEGSELSTSLRRTLDERVTALRERWVERITTSLDEGRVLDAVRASIRPPEPATRLSAELAVRLADEAGKAMAPDTPPEQWLALLEVVVESPVRRTVKPAGLPVGADETLTAAARKASGYVPQLARIMGIPIPPPPGPRRPVPARTGPARKSS